MHTISVRPKVVGWVAVCAALLAVGCGNSPKTAIRLIVTMPEGTQVDQLHIVGTVDSAPLLTTDLPEQAAGALGSTTDLVVWVADAVAGRSVAFSVDGRFQSALVAHGEGGLVPKLGRTLRITVPLAAATPCPTGQLNCAGTCTDATIDRYHCGSCDVACDPSQICRGSTCVHNPCGDGQHECSGSCYPDTDYLHCGPACVACPVPAAHGTASCVLDRCEMDCDGGFVPCPGACVDLNSDPQNCGSCGHACSGGQLCRNSNCTTNSCGPGYHDCPGLGCVTNTDVAHCGSSCTACTPPASGTATCDGTSCGFTCQSGTHKCGSECASNYSTQSCGALCSACPAVTNGTATCDGVSCGAACNNGYHDCSGQCVANTAVATCGGSCVACPTPSNGSATCDGVRCGVSCNGGYKPCGLDCIPNAQACATWRQVTPSVRPSARSHAAMAYDAQRQVMVLFGGWNGADLNDTWEFNGTTWSAKAPVAKPTARDSAAMAYDPVRHKIVLFGGYTTQAEADTWLWDGTNWTQPPSIATPPPARFGAAATWDGIGNVLMFGGDSTTASPYNDVWLWNGTQWNQCTTLCPGTPPSGRVGAGLIRDATQVVVFGGGADWDMTTVYGDMFALGIGGWSGLNVTRPSARGDMGFAWDAHRNNGILFGGMTGTNSVVGETWAWSGGAWTKLTPTTEPTARGSAAMAYDAQRQVIVLFGGTNGAVLTPTYYDETWEFVQ